GDTTASDMVDALLESHPKVDVHNSISTRVHNTFPFRGFALAVASKTLSTKSSHRRATDVLGAPRWPDRHPGREASLGDGRHPSGRRANSCGGRRRPYRGRGH